MNLVRFILAVIVAVGWSPLSGKGNIWLRARDAFWLAWDARTAPVADALEIAQRIHACRECPIFYRPLMTCGSPFHTDPELGCFCYMPFKARMKNARCWLRIRRSAVPWGWKE
jgi:hypothetical protein